MVASGQPVVENVAEMKTCKVTSSKNLSGIPVVDLSDRTKAKTAIVKACKEFGFFKVTNHHFPTKLSTQMESEAVSFFNLPQTEKENSGLPNYPFGYGSKNIGSQGDAGLVEYLIFSTTPQLISHNPDSIVVVPGIQESLRNVVYEYVSAIKSMACQVFEMIAEELQLNERDVLSRLIRHEKSDSIFRLNYYPPPCQADDLQELVSSNGSSKIGFGEHTDPHIMSVLRSNDVSGFQICLKDGAWVSVPPDPDSFFFNVGDCLQVMTNGRFKSVRHRVLAADSWRSRVSMIYFGGPPLTEKITPLSSVMEEGEVSLYKEFKWSDYKNSAYKTKLGDNRLRLFQKAAACAII
ncbi:hypothetical protein ABFX02_13G083700 [Erythranthe guttata]